jgi:hypothetical protein
MTSTARRVGCQRRAAAATPPRNITRSGAIAGDGDGDAVTAGGAAHLVSSDGFIWYVGS